MKGRFSQQECPVPSFLYRHFRHISHLDERHFIESKSVFNVFGNEFWKDIFTID